MRINERDETFSQTFRFINWIKIDSFDEESSIRHYLTPICKLWKKNPQTGYIVERHLWKKNPHEIRKLVFRERRGASFVEKKPTWFFFENSKISFWERRGASFVDKKPHKFPKILVGDCVMSFWTELFVRPILKCDCWFFCPQMTLHNVSKMFQIGVKQYKK